MMDQLIKNFPSQLREALAAGRKAKLSGHKGKINNVVISGLGGSGIGGDLVREYLLPSAKVPIVVNKDYFLPGFADRGTLVIISSYSGNTEETIRSLEQARRRKAKIACVTSGGKIADIALKHRLGLMMVPGTMPPRTCLGYSFVLQLFVLRHYRISGGVFVKQIESAASLLEKEQPAIQNAARGLAEKIAGKTPVLYICAGMESVAVRWRQQLNENTKILCRHHVIPEMNHNELVGWRDKAEDTAVIFLRNEDDFIRNRHRIGINREIIQKCTPHIFDVFSQGKSWLEKAMYLIHLGDWLSYFLAERRGVDALEVKVIDHLKGEMAKKKWK